MKRINMKDMLIESAEMVENEFPEMEWDELFERVYSLIEKIWEKYFDMNDADKFDYLVDGIIGNL